MINIINLLLFTLLVLGSTACVSHPTYHAPGEMDPDSKIENKISETAPAAQPEKLPTGQAVESQNSTLYTRAVERSGEASLPVCKASQFETYMANSEGRDAMFTAIKDFILESCMQHGCNFVLPPQEYFESVLRARSTSLSVRPNDNLADGE